MVCCYLRPVNSAVRGERTNGSHAAEKVSGTGSGKLASEVQVTVTCRLLPDQKDGVSRNVIVGGRQ